MSRVKTPKNKYMNTNTYPPHIINPSKMVRIKTEHSDYTKASNLTDWLFLKYDMTYKTFRNKSKKRRDELRLEYEQDTGKKVQIHATRDYED